MRLTQSTRQYLVSETAIFRHFKKLISVNRILFLPVLSHRCVRREVLGSYCSRVLGMGGAMWPGRRAGNCCLNIFVHDSQWLRAFRDSWGVSLPSSSGDSHVTFIASHFPYYVVSPPLLWKVGGDQAVMMRAGQAWDISIDIGFLSADSAGIDGGRSAWDPEKVGSTLSTAGGFTVGFSVPSRAHSAALDSSSGVQKLLACHLFCASPSTPPRSGSHRLLWLQEHKLKQLKHFAKRYTLPFSPSD